MKNKDQQEWNEKLTSGIIKALVMAWEAGKKQSKTPYQYTLDTDSIGKPLFDLITSEFSLREKQVREEMINILEETLPDCSGCTYDKDEGTHQSMSKQHFRKFYLTSITNPTKEK